MDDLFSRLARRAIAKRRTVRPQTAPVFATVNDAAESNEVRVAPAQRPDAPIPTPLQRPHEFTPPTASATERQRGAVAPASPAPVTQHAFRIDPPPSKPGHHEAETRPVRSDTLLAGDEQSRTKVAPLREWPVTVRAEPQRADDSRRGQTGQEATPFEARTVVLQPQVIRTVESRTQGGEPTARREPPQSPPSPPLIEVTIGQIELRTPPASMPRRPPAHRPALSLESYAAERKDGRR